MLTVLNLQEPLNVALKEPPQPAKTNNPDDIKITSSLRGVRLGD